MVSFVELARVLALFEQKEATGVGGAYACSFARQFPARRMRVPRAFTRANMSARVRKVRTAFKCPVARS